MQHAGSDAAQEIEDQEAEMTEGILDIVGEDPEEGHIGDEMPPAAM